jgi:hypothetical protein
LSSSSGSAAASGVAVPSPASASSTPDHGDEAQVARAGWFASVTARVNHDRRGADWKHAPSSRAWEPSGSGGPVSGGRFSAGPRRRPGPPGRRRPAGGVLRAGGRRPRRPVSGRAVRGGDDVVGAHPGHGARDCPAAHGTRWRRCSGTGPVSGTLVSSSSALRVWGRATRRAEAPA